MNSEPVNCPNSKCGVELGRAVAIEGLVFFRVGVLLLREVRGICMQCGRTVYWSVSDKAMERMLREASAVIFSKAG